MKILSLPLAAAIIVGTSTAAASSGSTIEYVDCYLNGASTPFAEILLVEHLPNTSHSPADYYAALCYLADDNGLNGNGDPSAYSGMGRPAQSSFICADQYKVLPTVEECFCGYDAGLPCARNVEMACMRKATLLPNGTEFACSFGPLVCRESGVEECLPLGG